MIRFNIEYKIMYFEEKMPENFTIRELDLFSKFVDLQKKIQDSIAHHIIHFS